MKKRIFSILLSFCMVFTIMNVPVMAASLYTFPSDSTTYIPTGLVDLSSPLSVTKGKSDSTVFVSNTDVGLKNIKGGTLLAVQKPDKNGDTWEGTSSSPIATLTYGTYVKFTNSSTSQYVQITIKVLKIKLSKLKSSVTMDKPTWKAGILTYNTDNRRLRIGAVYDPNNKTDPTYGNIWQSPVDVTLEISIGGSGMNTSQTVYAVRDIDAYVSDFGVREGITFNNTNFDSYYVWPSCEILTSSSNIYKATTINENVEGNNSWYRVGVLGHPTSSTFQVTHTVGGSCGTNVEIYTNYTLYTPTPTPIPTPKHYYLYYDANGGSRGNVPSSQEMTYEDIAWVTSNIPTREGYDFVGWNTNANGTGTTYSSGACYKQASIPPTTATLYAQWREIPKYSIYYNANGGNLGNVPASVLMNRSDATYITQEKPSKGALDFINWNTKADGTGTTYTANQLYKAAGVDAAGDITLYAQYIDRANSLYSPSYIAKESCFNVRSENVFDEKIHITKIQYQLKDGNTVIKECNGIFKSETTDEGAVVQNYKAQMDAPDELQDGKVHMTVVYSDGKIRELENDIALLDVSSDYVEGIRYIGNGVMPNEKSKWSIGTLKDKLFGSLTKTEPKESIKLGK